MSFVVKSSTLSQEDAAALHTCLVLKSQPKKNNYSKKASYSTVKLLSFFLKKNDELFLPFNLGLDLLGKLPNSAKPHQTISPLSVTLRDYQRSPVKEALEQLDIYGTTLLHISTSAGKTVMALYMVSELGLRCLVIAPRDGIAAGWSETITAFGGKAGRIEAGVKTYHDIMICLPGSVHHADATWLAGVGTLVLDETHMLCNPSSVSALLCSHPRYIIGCSATPEDNIYPTLMPLLLGEHKVELIIDKPFSFYRFKTHVKPEVVSGSVGVDFIGTTKNLIVNKERNLMILEWCRLNAHHKIIIHTRLCEHVDILASLLTEAGIDNDTMYGAKKQYQDSAVLIGNIGKIGTGFDEARACRSYKGKPSDMLICATSIANVNLFQQCKGRVDRSNYPIVVYLEDDWSNSTKHTLLAVNYSKDHAGHIMSVEAPISVPLQVTE